MSKLIIIRGNSGSEKTTVAKDLRSALGENTMLVSQDTIRREILNVKDKTKNPAGDLIHEICMFGSGIGFDVIVEGILSKKKYGSMVQRLLENFDGKKYIYYFDTPLDETIRRHNTKLDSSEFGEKEMREWYTPKDYLGIENEHIFDEKVSKDDISSTILRHAKQRQKD